jgi:PHD finger protein 20
VHGHRPITSVISMSEKASMDQQPSCSSSQKDARYRSKEKMDFVVGSLLEARDFNNEWFSAKVVEVDCDEREVLVHFQKWSSRYDEWISMDSARLRPVPQTPE